MNETPIERITERLQLASIDGEYRCLPLPVRLGGELVYVVFHGHRPTQRGVPVVVSGPFRWSVFTLEGDSAAVVEEAGIGIVGLPALAPFELRRPGPPAKGRAARAKLAELIGRATPELARGAVAPERLAGFARSLVDAGLGEEELARWRQVAPELFRWCLGD